MAKRISRNPLDDWEVVNIKTFIWSYVSTPMNILTKRYSEPKEHEKYLYCFEYCSEYRKYCVQVLKWKSKFLIRWNDWDDTYLDKVCESQQEANAIVCEMKEMACWSDLECLLELYERIFENFMLKF